MQGATTSCLTIQTTSSNSKTMSSSKTLTILLRRVLPIRMAETARRMIELPNFPASAPWLGGGLLAAFTLIRRAMRQRRPAPLAQSLQETLAGIANALKDLREVDVPTLTRQIRELRLSIDDRARVQEEHDATLQEHSARLADHGRRIRKVELRLESADLDGEGHLG